MKENIFSSKSKSNRILSAVSISVMLSLMILFIVLYGKHDKIPYLSAAISFGTMLYHFVMRLAVGSLTTKLLYSKLNPEWRWFQTTAFERKIYKLIKVKKWKIFMPTGDPESFSLKKHTPQEIAKTMCGAELVHELNILLSFLPILLAIPFGSLSVFVITSVAAALCDLPFVIMQRFNRPRMLRFANKKQTQ
ncbi:MAG: hypothetical protein IJE48_06265 [Clostridia bacterium]|nr:hypothetical protein [Clostridia bacterium]